MNPHPHPDDDWVDIPGVGRVPYASYLPDLMAAVTEVELERLKEAQAQPDEARLHDQLVAAVTQVEMARLRREQPGVDDATLFAQVNIEQAMSMYELRPANEPPWDRPADHVDLQFPPGLAQQFFEEHFNRRERERRALAKRRGLIGAVIGALAGLGLAAGSASVPEPLGGVIAVGIGAVVGFFAAMAYDDKAGGEGPLTVRRFVSGFVGVGRFLVAALMLFFVLAIGAAAVQNTLFPK